jgi:hypothetical protein
VDARLIRFVGGPLHGREQMVPDDWDRIEMPELVLSHPPWVLAEVAPGAPLPITTHVYVRNPWHQGGEPVPYVLEEDVRRLVAGSRR